MFFRNAATAALLSSLLLLAQACERLDSNATNSSIPGKEVASQKENVSTDISQPDLTTDENLFIFSADNTGDTSFVLVLKKEPSTINATYYELLPHGDSNEPAGKVSQLFNFEGIHFTIDASKWRSILEKSTPLLTSNHSIRYSELRDESKFTLAHNSTLKLCNDFSNPAMATAFRELEHHILKVLEKDIFQKKLTSSAFAFK